MVTRGTVSSELLAANVQNLRMVPSVIQVMEIVVVQKIEEKMIEYYENLDKEDSDKPVNVSDLEIQLDAEESGNEGNKDLF